MATDANGTELFVGDEVVLRAKVTHVQGEHVLTVGNIAPSREHWFHGAVTERTAQGVASLDAEKRAAAPAAAAAAPVEIPAAPNVPAVAGVGPKEEAILYVMSKEHTREDAEKIVDQYGYRSILEDRDDEAAFAKKAAAAVAAATAGLPTPDASNQNSSQAPTGASGSAPTQSAAGTSQTEAPKEADGSAPASASAA